MLYTIRETKETTGEQNDRPNIAEKCGIIALAAMVINYLDDPNVGNFPRSFRKGLNCGAGDYYAKTCTTWKGGELVPEWVEHLEHNEGAREHRRAYTLATGETIKTAYTTKAGAFFLVFENEETGARRIWTVYER